MTIFINKLSFFGNLVRITLSLVFINNSVLAFTSFKHRYSNETNFKWVDKL